MRPTEGFGKKKVITSSKIKNIYLLTFYLSNKYKISICVSKAAIVTSIPKLYTLNANAGINIIDNVTFMSKLGLYIS